MDPSTIAGIGLALAAIFGSMVMEGGSPAALFLPAAMMLVFGGTIGAAMAGSLMHDVKATPKHLIRAFTKKATAPGASVDTIVALATRARREGLLALESEVAAVEDPFLRRALEMAVDGTDSDELAEILGAEIDAKRAADHGAAKFFHDMGGTPRPSPSSARSSAWCTSSATSRTRPASVGRSRPPSWRPCGASWRPTSSGSPWPTGSSGSPRPRPRRWNSRSRASWPSRPGTTRASSPRSCRACSRPGRPSRPTSERSPDAPRAPFGRARSGRRFSRIGPPRPAEARTGERRGGRLGTLAGHLRRRPDAAARAVHRAVLHLGGEYQQVHLAEDVAVRGLRQRAEERPQRRQRPEGQRRRGEGPATRHARSPRRRGIRLGDEEERHRARRRQRQHQAALLGRGREGGPRLHRHQAGDQE